MSSIYGQSFILSLFGESHGEKVGVSIDGIPAGTKIDTDFITNELLRRSAASFEVATKRTELDIPHIISGVKDGFATGSPLCALFDNNNINSKNYDDFSDIPRPGHADYTASIRYRGFNDLSGGGHLSGRLTLPLVFAGAIAKLCLQAYGISVCAHISSILDVCDIDISHTSHSNLWHTKMLSHELPFASDESSDEAMTLLKNTRQSGNSVGGSIECFIYGMPTGIGNPIFDNLESKISQTVFSVPAVKALSFGLGEYASTFTGDAFNDSYILCDGKIASDTNNCGGILGGISNGMPIFFKATIKPTPSIFLEQNTLNIKTGLQSSLHIQGRHDPCIAIRAVPAIEAAAAIAVLDLLLGG